MILILGYVEPLYIVSIRRILLVQVSHVNYIDGSFTPLFHNVIFCMKYGRKHNVSSSVLSAEIECGTLSPVIGGKVKIFGNGLGSRATYLCDPGYTLVGSSELICQLSESEEPVWSSEAPICSKYHSNLLLRILCVCSLITRRNV